ncbi:tyrosine-type recombinase/integrase [Alkalihalobacillus pseudalcaliphilus]|uniref:tyrosine-type recombinase/integrase n=1 Tax=Alkalihalobacillus pseudalcaliphilus TaxID=79884 RepID=UPI00064D895C|nr:site-specific integrase [Alkalihalobacillus pseudalcaliphilus]KMK77596.1 recombinase XerC [Alkalihalobacillus pseudalcaliphilus]
MATIRKLKSNNWQARVSHEGKEFSIGTFKKKKEAELAAGKVEERLYYGLTLNDRNMLFEDVVNDWLNNYKKNNLKDITFEHYESTVRLHIIPDFKSRKIVQIKRTDINNWLNKYAQLKDKDGNDKYSAGSRLRYLSIMKSIFHYAVHHLEVLEKNPCDKLRIPIKDSTEIRKDVKYYSLTELNQLLDYMDKFKHQRFNEYKIYYMLMYFLSQTGLRISEALALQWSDIKGNMLNVDKQTSRDKNNNLIITSLKNTSSYRTIKLDQSILKELKKFKLLQLEMALKYSTFKKNDYDIIFQNGLGNYMISSTVRDSIRSYSKQAKVPYKGTHGFRHTHAVLLLESGASVVYVSKRLGHKTIKTTSDTYLDITEKIEEDELQKFASYTKR